MLSFFPLSSCGAAGSRSARHPVLLAAPGARQQLQSRAGPTQALRLLETHTSEPEGGKPCHDPASHAVPELGVEGMALSLVAAVALAMAVLLVLPEPAAAAVSLDQVLGSVEELVAGAGVLGPLIFIAAYTVATVFLVPGSVLTLAAGALFGPLLGTAVVSVASTLGASAAFLVGRYVARPLIEEKLFASNKKLASVDRAIAAKGPRIVLLLRLSPLFPFTLLNYACSLSSIEFWPYVLSSWAGMLPGTFAYVALGGAGRAAAETASGSGLDPLRLGLYVVGVAATLWVTKIISSTATKALAEASDELGGSGEGGSSGTGG